jgi:hypothetical protein
MNTSVQWVMVALIVAWPWACGGAPPSEATYHPATTSEPPAGDTPAPTQTPPPPEEAVTAEPMPMPEGGSYPSLCGGIRDVAIITAKEVPDGLVLQIKVRESQSLATLDQKMMELQAALRSVTTATAGATQELADKIVGECPLVDLARQGANVLVQKENQDYRVTIQPKAQQDKQAVIAKASQLAT